MLVFIDESGDPGRKITKGSSPYFVVSMIIFNDNEEANACDQRIELLRRELGLPSKYEFHFSDNSDRVRQQFLEAINRYQFIYFAVVIDKNPKKLYGPGFEDKETFYKYTCQMVLTNATQYLNQAILIIDKSGNPIFRSRLAKYLKGKINSNQRNLIKKIKQQNSQNNNLLQLEDYISGVTARKLKKQKNWQNYYKYIRSKEYSIQIWPK